MMSVSRGNDFSLADGGDSSPYQNAIHNNRIARSEVLHCKFVFGGHVGL